MTDQQPYDPMCSGDPRDVCQYFKQQAGAALAAAHHPLATEEQQRGFVELADDYARRAAEAAVRAWPVGLPKGGA